MTITFTMIAAGVGVLLLLAVMRNRMRGSQADISAKKSGDRSSRNSGV
jgi:hypothetical protein